MFANPFKGQPRFFHDGSMVGFHRPALMVVHADRYLVNQVGFVLP
jgi:hypothetical protein